MTESLVERLTLLIYFAEYAKLKPALFAKFLPGVLPQTSINDLDTYIAETKQMQEDMKLLDGFGK